jgi:hypothetical protein
MDRIKKRWIRTPRPNFGRVVLERLDGLIHLGFDRFSDIANGRHRSTPRRECEGNSNMNQRTFIFSQDNPAKGSMLED